MGSDMIVEAWNAAAAASLAERVAGIVEPVPGCARPVDDERSDVRRTWQHLVADGREDRFARRLAALGPAPASTPAQTPWSVDGLLGAVRPAGAEALTWDEPVAALLRELAELDRTDEPAPRVALGGVSFGDLLAPLVAVGSRRASARLGQARERLAPAAWAQLEQQLARRLSLASEPTLQLEFSIFRALRRSPIERLVRLATQPDSRELHAAFVGRPRTARLSALVRDYPALARAWAQLVEDWVEATAELVLRLETDAPEVARLMGLEAGELPRIEAVSADLSDLHRGGRTVCRLRCASGHEVIYKPRNIDIEDRWTALLRWLGQRGAPVELVGLRVLPRTDYGWVEVAQARPCASASELPEFYRRAGALLCLVYLLAGNDCHRENLIACGDHPVLVDVETLMHPGTPLEPNATDDAHSVLARRLAHSVLNTALLPHWSPNPAGGGHDSGGLGPGGAVKTNIEGRVLERAHTDEARFVTRRITLAPALNVPQAAGEVAVVDRYVDSIVAGFSAMARFVVEMRAALLAGPVAAFADVRVRVLMRATAYYERVRSRSLRPEAMRSGAARSVAIDALVRPLLRAEEAGPADAGAWSMVEEERRSLERLDIPRFELRADEPATTWRAAWSCSGLELARQRILGLGPAEIQRQVDLIRASFDAREAIVAPATRGAGEQAQREAGDDELRAAVEQLVTRITELATRGHGDTASWITLEVVENSLAYKLRPMGPGLYNGTAGVGLFLAAAAAITGDAGAHTLALAAVRSLRTSLADRDEPLAPGTALGGVMGVPSAAYALAWMGRLLHDETLLDDAARILRRVDAAAIAADRSFDLAGGAAGAIMVMLAVHHMRPAEDLLARALACGEHLLRHRTAALASWPAPSGIHLAGLAHGASGIACALERLTLATGDLRFREAARTALDYERSLFHADAGNWRDIRPDVPGPGPSFMTSWCNGACGIGMTRLDLREAPHGHEELDTAIATTTREALGGLDHFCCGSSGRADFLLEAGYRLARPQHVHTSRRVLTGMLDRMRKRGTFALSRHSHRGSEHPGLFRGLGGIGWLCLRHLAPERLPAIGTLDGPR